MGRLSRKLLADLQREIFVTRVSGGSGSSDIADSEDCVSRHKENRNVAVARLQDVSRRKIFAGMTVVLEEMRGRKK